MISRSELREIMALSNRLTPVPVTRSHCAPEAPPSQPFTLERMLCNTLKVYDEFHSIQNHT